MGKSSIVEYDLNNTNMDKSSIVDLNKINVDKGGLDNFLYQSRKFKNFSESDKPKPSGVSFGKSFRAKTKEKISPY